MKAELDPVEADRRDRATAAALQATGAAAELLRFAREGADLRGTFGDVDVVEMLLDAAKMAIECLQDDEDAERFSDVHAALVLEIEGWAG
ncbi:hypothetical protein [Rhizobium anhuiense]